MSGSSMETEIRAALMGVGAKKVSKDILHKCVTIAKNRNISPSQLANTWETHSLNHNITELTRHTFPSFQSTLLSRSKKHHRNGSTPTTDGNGNGHSNSNSNSTSGGIVSPNTLPKMKRGAVMHRPALGKRYNPNELSTPPRAATTTTTSTRTTNSNKRTKVVDFDAQLEHVVTNVHSPLANSSSSSATIVTPSKHPRRDKQLKEEEVNAYGNRTNAGQIVITYNPNTLGSISKTETNTTTVTITQPYGTLSDYKYMTDKDRSSALNQHLASFQTSILQQEQTKLDKPTTCTSTTTITNNEEEEEYNHHLQHPQFEYIGVPHTDTQFNIGRICNEAHEGKLNSTSILLEGSRIGSNGARIELDVRNVKQYSLFPGQIVGVKGMNTSGRKMVVEEIVEGLDLDGGDDWTKGMKEKKDMEMNEVVNQSGNDIDDRQEVMDSTTKKGMKIVSVAGPYTSNQDLKYEPLMDLLNFVVQETPDVVIMMGPFVDMRQQRLENEDEVILEYELDDNEQKSGGSEGGETMKRHVNYETLFAAKISQELEDLYEEVPDLKTKFVLVPSLEDGVSEPVFPQPPLKDSLPNGGKSFSAIPETQEIPFGSLCLQTIENAGRPSSNSRKESDRRVFTVPNPATLQINDITIGLTSTDTLFNLSNEMICQGLPPGTRLCRIAEHFLQQRSYYPLFPPHISEATENVHLDVNNRSGFTIPVQPDILLLPSKVMNFVKDVSNGTTVVNPGYLVKGNKGGTFSVMDVHPPKEGDNLESKGVRGRIRVEIRRI